MTKPQSDARDVDAGLQQVHKWEKFSLDMLITLAARAGQRPTPLLEAALN